MSASLYRIGRVPPHSGADGTTCGDTSRARVGGSRPLGGIEAATRTGRGMAAD